MRLVAAALPVAAVLVLAPPAVAACPKPTIRTTLFESPEVLVVEAKSRRAGGVVYRDAVVCDRASGRRSRGWTRFSGGGAAGGGSVVSLFGGRYLEVEEWGGGGESDATTRRLVDVRTGRTTAAVTVDGTEDEGDEEVAGAGALVQLTRGTTARIVVRRPGGGSRMLPTGGATDGGLALAARTVYWQTGGVVRATPISLPVVAAAKRPPTRGVAGGRGVCEPRGARTLLRTKAFRLFRATDGTTYACARKRGRARALTALVPSVPGAGPPEQLQLLAGPTLAYRYPTAGGGVAYVVADLVAPRAVHVALLPAAATAVAQHPEGIVTTGPAGVTFTRDRQTTVLDAATDADEPAITTTGDGIAAYWSTPVGPRLGAMAVAVPVP